jgi:hypothetical protein
MGTGKVVGRMRADSEKTRLVEERACRVKGRSRSNCASEGFAAGVVGSGDASTDRVEARRGILSLDCGKRMGSGSSGFGTLGRPLREKASLKTGASLLCWREGGCGRGMGEDDRVGSACERRYKKYRMAHFRSRTGWLSRRE